jgi:hypothetical protein
MATRRKYKAGGRVLPVEPEPVTSVDVSLSPAPSPEPPASVTADDIDALRHAINGTQRAEALQKAHLEQQHQRSSVDAVIERIPDLSDHKKEFLRSHPEFVLDTDKQNLMRLAYSEALEAGIADDSAEMNRAVLDGVERQLHHARQREELRSAPLSTDDDELMRPATPGTENSGRQEFSPPRVSASERALPSIRRSMPMSAPVSREVPMSNGQRTSDFGKVTLTAEQRIIARNSFSDPSMSNEEKEMLYARNLQKYRSMLADGSYSDDGRR